MELHPILFLLQVSFVPMNVTNDLNTYEDFFNFLDEESRGQVQMISRKLRLFSSKLSNRQWKRKKKDTEAFIQLGLILGTNTNMAKITSNLYEISKTTIQLIKTRS